MSHITLLFKAAPIPFSIAGIILFCLILIPCKYNIWSSLEWNCYLFCFCFAFCSGLGIILCSIADALSRIREYQRIKYLFLRYGFRKRFILKMSGSRCQRDAIITAAKETGFDQKTKELFYIQGYRWYHIIPDQLRINPLAFFSPTFLKATFLAEKKKKLKAIMLD